MKAREVNELLQLVFAAYPTQRQRMSDADQRGMLAAWALALADISFEDGKLAIARILMTSKWMPTIAEVREQVVHSGVGAPNIALEAWGDLCKRRQRWGQARPPGHEGHPPITDPITERILGTWSWFDFCQGNVRDHTADRARFCEAYAEIQREQRREAQLSYGATALPAATEQRQIPSAKRAEEQRGLGDIVSGLLPGGSS